MAAARLTAADLLRGPAVRAAIASLDLPSGSHVLDGGCGIGSHVAFLSEAAGPAGHVTAIDTSPDILCIAAEVTRDLVAAGRAEVALADVERLPFAAGAFDLAWSADTLHGLASGPDIAARELARVTRPGGLVALFFWSSQRLLPGHAALESRLEVAFADAVPYMRVPSGASFQFALGWLRRARLTDLAARTFVADIQGPLDAAHQDALASAFDMLWTPLAPAIGAGDRDELARLCRRNSPDFLPNDIDYHGSITCTLFSGRRALDRSRRRPPREPAGERSMRVPR